MVTNSESIKSVPSYHLDIFNFWWLFIPEKYSNGVYVLISPTSPDLREAPRRLALASD
jgi:hypothetical protein